MWLVGTVWDNTDTGHPLSLLKVLLDNTDYAYIFQTPSQCFVEIHIFNIPYFKHPDGKTIKKKNSLAIAISKVYYNHQRNLIRVFS